MDSITALLARLDNLDSIEITRKELVELIRGVIEEDGDRFTASRKFHLANAIGSLSLNVDALVQPTNVWLRLCIADLQKATGQIDDRYVPNHLEVSEVSKDELLAALESIALTLR